jgi:hypothetical protein
MPKEYFHGTDGMLMTDRLPIIDSTGSSWSCPVCGRRFKQRTAEHTCQLFTLDHHLAGKPPEVVALCNAYLAAAAESGPVSIEPLKTAIMLRTRSNFGSVRVTRKHLSCYLILGGLPDDPRIVKSARYTSNKLACGFDLTCMADVDDEVRSWLHEACQLAQ